MSHAGLRFCTCTSTPANYHVTMSSVLPPVLAGSRLFPRSPQCFPFYRTTLRTIFFILFFCSCNRTLGFVPRFFCWPDFSFPASLTLALGPTKPWSVTAPVFCDFAGLSFVFQPGSGTRFFSIFALSLPHCVFVF